MSRVRLDLFDPKKGFSRGAPRWLEAVWYVCKVLFFLSPWPWPSRWKVCLLKLFGAKLGAGVVIKPRVNIHFPWRLVVGNFCWLGEEVFILNLDTVTMGDHVCVSQRAFLCTGNHDYRTQDFAYRNAPIIIGEGVWVGAQVWIGPGVEIGNSAVIQAGAVVTGNLEAAKVYGGNPAVVSKDRWRSEPAQ